MPAKAELALLRVAKARLGLREDEYRGILECYGGSSSASALDASGFSAVMDRFRDLGFTSTARAKSYGDRDGMASPGQVATVRKLWAAWASDASEAGLNSFLERQAKVSSLRFLDTSKAGAVITALKAMVARKETSDGG